MSRFAKPIAIILTVKNDASGFEETLGGLLVQSRPADQIVVVDGGSNPRELERLRSVAARHPQVELLERPGANIARGRNIATRAARCDIVASTDCGCVADRCWLERISAPFEEDDAVDVVAGFYHTAPATLLENVIGLCTMRGQLTPVNPTTFNPSGRSIAYSKKAWRLAGGWPEWIRFSEDTLFDHKLRSLPLAWRFAGDAVVHWRPRRTAFELAKQFYHYGTGRGHTGINKESFHHGLRNVVIVFAFAILSLASPWFLAAAIPAAAHFYIFSLGSLVVRVAKAARTPLAIPVAYFVLWIVGFSGLWGYVVGRAQRWRDPERFDGRMHSYLPSRHSATSKSG